MEFDTKCQYMVEWWHNAQQALKDECIDHTKFETIKELSKSSVLLRASTVELFDLTNTHNVPVLVFSAGIGNVIDTVLQHQHIMHPNVHVIANHLFFNEDGMVGGFVDEPIHVFNKQEQLIVNTPYYAEVAHRHNVLLLGDSLGDSTMSTRVEDNIVKMGYLNLNPKKTIESHLAVYADHFDIVMIYDSSMELARGIVDASLKFATQSPALSEDARQQLADDLVDDVLGVVQIVQ